MDPITHALVGASIAIVTGEPLSLLNPVLVGSMVGAIIPDGDIIMQLKGHKSYLKNHRGISHSIFLAPVFSLFITFLLSFLYKDFNFSEVFLYSLSGCISHLILDITNTYGARVLWPFYKKRLTWNLILVYDPMIVITALLIILPIVRNTISPIISITIFILYILFRYYMKKSSVRYIIKEMTKSYSIHDIYILPSMIGFFKWHFIVVSDNKRVVGEIDYWTKRIRIIDTKEKIEKDIMRNVMSTQTADFFKDFTPIFHVHCESLEDGYIFRFVDLRYHIAKEFVHNATLIVDNNYNVVKSLFHPYSISKNIEL